MAVQFHAAGSRPTLSLRPQQQQLPQEPLAQQQPTQAADPFVWAEAGTRLTPEQVLARRELAKSQIAAGTDMSPIGHWTQGVDRVLQALMGGLEARRADKAEKANTDYSQQISGALSPASGPPDLATATRAASDPFASAEVRETAKFWLDRLVPKQSTAQPYRWEDNAGNQWELGADGQTRRFFTDIAPKQMITNGQLFTSTNPFVEGAQPATATTLPQPGAIVDDPRISSQGGAGLAAPQTFPR